MGADIYDSANKFEDVAGLSDLLAPLVWIVADLRIFIDGHCVAFHHPLNWRLAVDLPIVGAKRDVDDSDRVVEVDDAFVLISITFAETHLLNLRRGRIILNDNRRIQLYALIVKVEGGKFLSCRDECSECFRVLDQGQARQGLLEVGGKPLTVLLRM